MPVLLVMDSRGKGLQERLNITAPGVVTGVIEKGGDISTLLKIANRKAVREEANYNTIIIAGGICSITKLRKQAKLRYKTTNKLIESVNERLRKGLQNIRGDNPKARVIVAPTVGIDLNTYNGTVLTDRKSQRKLNRLENPLDFKEDPCM